MTRYTKQHLARISANYGHNDIVIPTKMLPFAFIAVIVVTCIMTFSIGVVLYDSINGLGHEQFLQMHGGMRGGVRG